VGVASAIFQTFLSQELKKRITGPGADELILRIRHSAKLVATLPPDLQRAARDSYATSLKAVFFYAATCTLIAFIVRLPIPELSLDREEPKSRADSPIQEALTVTDDAERQGLGETEDDDVLDSLDEEDRMRPKNMIVRRLSTYESDDGLA